MEQAEVSIGPGTVPKLRLDARIRKLRGGKALVAGPHQALELSETAEFIRTRIDGVATVREIAEAVAAEYDIDAGTASADVMELIMTLIDNEVVTCGP
jgi:coenzyme PQQ synthesis protein D (PqqD)